MNRPEKFTKPQLRALLQDAGVVIPEGKVLKHQLVEMYNQYLQQLKTTEYSSEEDDDVIIEDALPPMKKVTVDLERLGDKKISEMLLERGVKVGPIVPSTRALYLKKLKKLVNNEEDASNADAVNENDTNAGGDSVTIVADITAGADEYSDDDDCVIVDDNVDKMAYLSNGDYQVNGTTTTTTQHSKVITEQVIIQQEEENGDTSFNESCEFSKVIDSTPEQILTHRNKTVVDESSAQVTTTTAPKVVRKSSTCWSLFVRLFLLTISLCLLAFFLLVVHVLMKNSKMKLIK